MDVRQLTDQTLSRMAGQAQRSGDWQRSQAAFAEIVRRRPRHAKAWVCLGECTAKVGFTEKGIEQVKRGVALRGDVGAYRSVLANLLFITGHCDESHREAKKAVELDRDNWTAHVLIARNMERTGHADEGLAYLQEVRAEVIQSGKKVDGAVLNALGQLLLVIKEYQKAREVFEEVLTQDSQHEIIQRTAYNGLGQTLDRLGHYDDAFTAFTKCAVVTKHSADGKAFNLTMALARIADSERVYSAEILNQTKNARDDNDHHTPVFLVGFPRSGTTLAEQILAAHAKIVTTGETPILESMGRSWSQHAEAGLPLRDLINGLDDDGAARLRKWYWESASRLLGNNWQEAGEEKILVDKQPMNITELGLIQLVFPRAKIIVMIRDPRDVCLSCYFQDFRLNESTACFLDLEDTAIYYAAVMKWYLQLRDRLTIPIMEIRYEELVNHFEETVRRMTEFVNLPWDESALRFQEKLKSRAVTTPSAAAVRESVSNKSIAKWHNYRKHFSQNEAIADTLQPYISCWGNPQSPFPRCLSASTPKNRPGQDSNLRPAD